MAIMLASCEAPENRRGDVAAIRVPLSTTVALDAIGDTYVRSGAPNQNQGSEPTFRVQSSGKNRGLLFFDTAAVHSAIGGGALTSATLELTIDSAASNWGSTGRPIAVHRLLQASAEYAATWNCAIDATIYNSQADCSTGAGTAWNMGANDAASLPFAQLATATAVITNNQIGTVSFDVTADVAAILNGSWAGYGFLIKKENESQNGQVEFVTRERGPAPRLVLTIDVPDGGSAMDASLDAGTQSRHFIASKDSHVRQGSPNRNYGEDSILRLQASGRNRALVSFDAEEIAEALGGLGLASARIELTIDQSYNNWGSDRSIGTHRLRQAWTELGATWNCAQDPNTNNSTDTDCTSSWVMWAPQLPVEQVAWVDPPSDTALISSGQTGVVSLDVTRDIACVLAGYTPLHGFLVKKEAEGQSGRVDFASRETATPPALVVEYGSGPGVSVSEVECTGSSSEPDGGMPDGGVCTPSGSDDDCDGQDDDCDGRADEAYGVTETACGVGACAATGERSCEDGSEVDSCTPGAATASDVSCDGEDDDCDGSADEGYVATETTCIAYGCHARGQLACVAGVLVDDCTAQGECVSEADCTDGVDNDQDGETDCTDEADCGGRGECELPPDPSTVAPPIDASAGTPFHALFSFLLEAEEPIQRDVEPGAIVPERAAVVSGHVRNRSGTALGGALVTVVGHPEFGHTRSREDGDFDILVEGGRELRLRFELPGYVAVVRAAHPPWRGADRLDDVVLTRYADESSVIETSGAALDLQVARGAMETDRDGARRATLLFTPGVTAEVQQPESSAPVAQPALSVHVTELSVGSASSNALPGPLPGSSAFLYAASFSADEAFALGAQDGGAELSQPALLYVENFTDFPAGSTLPAGWYDAGSARWVPTPSGLVIAVVAIENGLAAIDSDGDGAADDASTLAALGLSDAERVWLAQEHTPGQTLWRLPVSRLGTWSVSPAPGSLADATPPPRTNVPQTSSPRHVASVDVPVAGTPFSLRYSSDRVLGYGAGRWLDIDLGTPAELAVRPHHVRVSITPSTGLARSFRFRVPGSDAPASQLGAEPLPVDRVFRWDAPGLDLAGRALQGSYGVEVVTSYEYACGYRAVDAFGRYAAGATLAFQARVDRAEASKSARAASIAVRASCPRSTASSSSSGTTARWGSAASA